MQASMSWSRLHWTSAKWHGGRFLNCRNKMAIPKQETRSFQRAAWRLCISPLCLRMVSAFVGRIEVLQWLLRWVVDSQIMNIFVKKNGIPQIEGTEVEWTLGFALAEECRFSRQASNAFYDNLETDSPSINRAPSPSSSAPSSSHPTVCKIAIKTTSVGKQAVAGVRQVVTRVRNSVATAVRRMLVEPIWRLLQQIVECWERTKKFGVGIWKWSLRKKVTTPPEI